MNLLEKNRKNKVIIIILAIINVIAHTTIISFKVESFAPINISFLNSCINTLTIKVVYAATQDKI